MTADSTAEKAWEEYAIPEGLVYNMPNSSERRAFMAGRASRDAEVAELQGIVNQAIPLPAAQDLIDERDSLREQLAEANVNLSREMRARDALQAKLDDIVRDLAEAQATITDVREFVDSALAESDADEGEGWEVEVSADIIRSLLSAPSSTGGANKPEVVCLCGSTRFYDEFQAANYMLTMQGKIVLSVGFYPHAKAQHGHGEGIGHDSAEKVALDELHKRKIDMADRVLVLNVGGYIGESTRSEIEYAVAHGKPVDYDEPLGGNDHE